jgi:hypothetical protein
MYGAQELKFCQAPVAHACNPSYSGGRDQEDQGLKPAQANSSRDLTLKIPNTKKKKNRVVRVSQESGSRDRTLA